MKRPETLRNSLILVGVVAVAIAAYFFLVRGSAAAPTESARQVEVNSEVSEVLDLLHQLQSIHIDPQVIGKLNTGTLQNFHVDIPEGSRGKANPFAH